MRMPAKDIVYVVIQLCLFIAYLFTIPFINFYVGAAITLAGLALTIIGVILILLSIVTLNKNLSPFPTPLKEGRLVTVGVYKYIRHPIYTGILLSAFGYSIYTHNTLRLIVFALLLILFVFKAKYEERQLANKFPEYKNYKAKSYMFFPGLY